MKVRFEAVGAGRSVFVVGVSVSVVTMPVVTALFTHHSGFVRALFIPVHKFSGLAHASPAPTRPTTSAHIDNKANFRSSEQVDEFADRGATECRRCESQGYFAFAEGSGASLRKPGDRGARATISRSGYFDTISESLHRRPVRSKRQSTAP
jgi:hypothetical protein